MLQVLRAYRIGLGLCREAHEHAVGLAQRGVAPELVEDVWCRDEIDVRGALRLLQLVVGVSLGLKSETAAALTITSALPERAMTASCISSAVWTGTTSTPIGAGLPVGPTTSVTLPPRLLRGPGDLGAHQSRGAVADEAHRVDRLLGAAGRDDHVHSDQLLRVRERGAGLGDDLLWLDHPSGARCRRTSARPEAGPDDVHVALAQSRDVLLGGGVFPHLGVHRRRHHDRAIDHQQRGGHEVVGHTQCRAGERVGRGRGDDGQVCTRGRALHEERRGLRTTRWHRPPADRGEGLLPHELLGRTGHDDPDVGPRSVSVRTTSTTL